MPPLEGAGVALAGMTPQYTVETPAGVKLQKFCKLKGP